MVLWVLNGTLPRRSVTAADRVADALSEHAVHVSIGSFLDLRYLLDAKRISESALAAVERTVEHEAFSVVPLDLACHKEMRNISRQQVFDPFDRIIANISSSVRCACSQDELALRRGAHRTAAVSADR